MKKYALAIFFCFVVYAAQANEEGPFMSKAWIPSGECTSIEIKQFDYIVGDRVPVKVLHINDRESVKKLANRIVQIPAEGDMFKSLLAKEKIDMIFSCGQAQQLIEIYDGRFKTPSTGFNSSTESKEQEEDIYRDVISLLGAQLNQKILKIAKFEYEFPDFDIVYKGEEPLDAVPVSVSGQRDIFIIKDKDRKEQSISITSGQRTPQPYPFEVNNKSFILQTYQTSKSERIYPDYFQIESSSF